MNIYALSAILAVFFALSECFHLNSLEENINDDRIIGGKTATPGQFPYMAALRYPRQENGTIFWSHHLCGGGILSSRWIVTCAHCTQFRNISNLAIAVGSHHISNDGQIYRLDRIVNHPAFNWTGLRNDIALLRTNTSIEFNAFVQPISLMKQFVGGNTVAVTSGWGAVKNASPSGPTHLQYLEVKTLTNKKCGKRVFNKWWKLVYEGTLCAFARFRQGVCYGDSGSPLVANGQIIGLAAWVRQCAFGFPDGYTRISVFLDWIREVSDIEAV